MSCAILAVALHITYASAAPAKTGWDLLPDILRRIVPPTFPDRDFDVTEYGAAGDGVTDCNLAFKKAIAACTEAGGGRVVVPKGKWLTNGPVHLDNNVNLHVTKDATILTNTPGTATCCCSFIRGPEKAYLTAAPKARSLESKSSAPRRTWSMTTPANRSG